MLEGAGLPTNVVVPIQSSNVGEMAPASYEPSSGVEYSNIPFYGNRKMFGNEKSYQKRGNKGKGKKIKVDPANRFSVLQGLTEEKQKKMFDKFENKSKIEEKYEEKCEEVCKDEEEEVDFNLQSSLQESSSIRMNRRLLEHAPAPAPISAPDFDDDDKNCWCPKTISVLVIGTLALHGFNQTITNLDCKISPDFGINHQLHSCVRTNESFNCNSTGFVEASDKKFFEHYNKSKTFDLYCPKNGSMEKVAEANATRASHKYKRQWMLNFVQKEKKN
ncbi:hypothetical protein ACQ4LE_003543 [Meloidogyne hapla]